MPFTPYHLGPPALILGTAIWLKYDNRSLSEFWESTKIYWLAIFVGSVSPDIQGMISIFFNPDIKLHGFSHTIVGSVVYALAFGLFYLIVKSYLLSIDTNQYWYNKFHIDLRSTSVMKMTLVNWLSILILHLLPDVFIYTDMQIFWPFSDVNYGTVSDYQVMASFMGAMFIIGVILLVIRYVKYNNSVNPLYR